MKDWKAILRLMGLLMMAEGIIMALCGGSVWAVFGEGGGKEMMLCGGGLIAVGGTLGWGMRKFRTIEEKRMSYVLVVGIWLVMGLAGSLPFLATGATPSVTNAIFEAMSGITSTGATIFSDIEVLPKGILLWRSALQWTGGFGIMLLVLAIVPRLGINKYSLYTAEASRADNTSKTLSSTGKTVRQTLSVYVGLTIGFVVVLMLTGMNWWPALNLTMCNISSGGFSIYNDSIAGLTPVQQYVLAGEMLLSGINFTLLYLIVTFQWDRIRNKLDQFSFYIGLAAISIIWVGTMLHLENGYAWNDALRYGTVQSLSVLTTTGSVVADTTGWWIPISFWFLMLMMCGGMAGSTTGGLKAMRILILWRNVKGVLLNRLHPRAYNPVRLNGHPINEDIIRNVMVLLVITLLVLICGTAGLMLCGTDATEALGAITGCLTGYGPGLGKSGGFGSYAEFGIASKWICTFTMLLGRLECLTVIVIFMPAFWKKR